MATYVSLVVGIGVVDKVGKLREYDVDSGESYPMWDRLVSHSIRPDGVRGFLLPYHTYLAPTGDDAEDTRRSELARDIAVAPEFEHVRDFSYAAELTTPDVALSIVIKCLESVRLIRQHGIAEGKWAEREEWLNEQIGRLWRERGAFPGTGAALEAVGMRLGTALSMELLTSGDLDLGSDPWPVVEKLLSGAKAAPRDCYASDLAAVKNTWNGLSDERRTLLRLLSRFSLTPAQMKRWFDKTERQRALQARIDDATIIENPYAIVEYDTGDGASGPIPMGLIDRGMLPDDTVAAQHPVPLPSRVESAIDARRVRAALVSVLRRASDEGDSLLSEAEALERVGKLDLARACVVAHDWVGGNAALLHGVVERLPLPSFTAEDDALPALQLADLRAREERLGSVLAARAGKEEASLNADWRALLIEAVTAAGGAVQQDDDRIAAALVEQSDALERITTRRLGVLVGRAGTGKTSVVGALLGCEKLAKDGILLLAPTGKARVRLGKATRSPAMTIAQFLNRLKRYDGIRQRPRFTSDEPPYRKEQTIVIDECSMVTMDDFVAVLNGLDLAHVRRIILVGDPNQLPPIGVGRPFADLVAHLDTARDSDDAEFAHLAGALARLTRELRTSGGEDSDTLRLAAWYTREEKPIDADFILSDLEHDGTFNDLEIAYWTTIEDLHAAVLAQMQKHLGLSEPSDVAAFNRALGLGDGGSVTYAAPDGCENFQILSPVRMQAHGVHDLNRWIQRSFRAADLTRSKSYGGVSLGDEEIVIGDKVIQTRNRLRKDAYNHATRQKEELYIANGDIGLVGPAKAGSGYLNVVFAGRPNVTVGYHGRDFGGERPPLELAYALTVHKVQGSEFGVVFAVLPKNCRPVSPELLYTALTRSRDRMVLFIEGADASPLYELTDLRRSETARRNTNLFTPTVRARADEAPRGSRLIHTTDKGHLVQSKSELVIANILYGMDIPYEYERRLTGTNIPGTMLPDFTFIDAAGDLIIWEHLGMMKHDHYRRRWERKRQWYEGNGLVVGKNVFTSEDGEGLDSAELRRLAAAIKARL